MCFEELGIETQVSVDQVCDPVPFGVVDGVEVGLVRDAQRGWRVRVLAEDGLAADDDELVPLGQVGCGPDDMLELVTPHGWSGADGLSRSPIAPLR